MTTKRIIRIDRIVVRDKLPPGLAGDTLRSLLTREISQRLDRSNGGHVTDSAAVSRLIADSVTSICQG